MAGASLVCRDRETGYGGRQLKSPRCWSGTANSEYSTHTHTGLHTAHRTCAHAHPQNLSPHPPPPQSWYCGPRLSSVQLKTDRIRASLHPPALALPLCFCLPLIIHPCQAKQPSVTEGALLDSISLLRGQSVSVHIEGVSNNGPACAFVLLSSVCLSFQSRYASVSLWKYAATHDRN